MITTLNVNNLQQIDIYENQKIRFDKIFKITEKMLFATTKTYTLVQIFIDENGKLKVENIFENEFDHKIEWMQVLGYEDSDLQVDSKNEQSDSLQGTDQNSLCDSYEDEQQIQESSQIQQCNFNVPYQPQQHQPHQPYQTHQTYQAQQQYQQQQQQQQQTQQHQQHQQQTLNILTIFNTQNPQKSFISMFQFDLSTNSIWDTFSIEFEKIQKIQKFHFFEKEKVLFLTNQSSYIYLYKFDIRTFQRMGILDTLLPLRLKRSMIKRGLQRLDAAGRWFLFGYWKQHGRHSNVVQQPGEFSSSNMLQVDSMYEQSQQDGQESQQDQNLSNSRISIEFSLQHSRTQSQVIQNDVSNKQQSVKGKQTIQLVLQLNKQRGKITDLIIDKKYNLLIIGDNTGYIYVYDINEKIQVQAFNANYKSLISMKLINGVLIVLGQDRCIREYELYVEENIYLNEYFTLFFLLQIQVKSEGAFQQVNSGQMTYTYRQNNTQGQGYNKNQIPPQQQLINLQQTSDNLFKIKLLTTPGKYRAYLYNTCQSYQLIEEEYCSCLNLYFITKNNEVFKLQRAGIDYLYIYTQKENISAIQMFLESKGIKNQVIQKIYTDQPNTNAGAQIDVIQTFFKSQEHMRRFLNEIEFKPNKNHIAQRLDGTVSVTSENFTKYIHTIFEHDLTTSLRTCIDDKIFVGKYYDITVYSGNKFDLEQATTDDMAPELQTFAFDIETTKEKLCFPNPDQGDQIMCISFQINNHIGGLIINAEKFSKGVHDFSYHVDDEKYAEYRVFYKDNEKETINFFIQCILSIRPQIIVTFNGDSFDFNFIEKRANTYNISLESIGFKKINTKGRFGTSKTQFTHNQVIHIDCYNWVQRDSYLPQGSQGLKGVTAAKLKYRPHELDPELMVPYAIQKPQMLAEYSISDSLATYYLYKKLIHGFIFALCTIIPLPPDDVLRRGTGTLCESLLCVKAKDVNVIYPDKTGSQELSVVDITKIEEQTKRIEEELQHANEQKQGQNEKEDIKEKINYQLQQRTYTQLNQETTKIMNSQTYTGGRVEAINSGLYRKDYEYTFATFPEAYTGYQQLMKQLDQDLEYYIFSKCGDCKKFVDAQKQQNKDIEEQCQKDDDFFPREIVKQYIEKHIINYNEVKEQILSQLQTLEQQFHQPCQFKPIIYHLDVSSMYPNIILTNRLQPHAVVSDDNCAACDFNFPENKCQRKMQWMWRGSVYPISLAEYQMLQKQIIVELQKKGVIPQKVNLTGQHDIILNKNINNEQIQQIWKNIFELEDYSYMDVLKQRIEAYSQKNYHVKTRAIERIKYSTICQRANSFYYDTVKSFRDRRYQFKDAQKAANKKAGALHDQIQQMRKAGASQDELMAVQEQYQKYLNLVGYNESLQLAHKAILNSFYGYAMRTGSRWYSMEMAACTTYVGSKIIQNARQLVQKIGIPLELDTDGIWCMLPETFPNIFTLKLDNGTKQKFEYPAAMLNAQTAKIFTNKQNQVRIGNTNTFEYSPENTIFFEIDGPYNAQFLSAAKEEGKKIKKRYCVFDEDNHMSELKGFEVKRRGELELIKQFQDKVFPLFLYGHSISETYKYAGNVANQYLSLVTENKDSQGKHIRLIPDNLLLELLTEQTTMKKALNTINKNQKSAAITIAKRLSQYLDDAFGTQGNLTCKFVVCKYPQGEPVSQRVIPSNIFQCSKEVQTYWLKKWTGVSQVDNLNLLDLLDWKYYYDRFVNQLMKIIIVPSGLQGVQQSVIQGVQYPQWIIQSRLRQSNKNNQITNYFDGLQEVDDDSDSEDENSEEEQNTFKVSKKQDEENKKQNIIKTISETLQKYDIHINKQILDQIERISNKQILRSDDALSWLDQQKRQWLEMYNNDQLGLSLKQLYILRSKQNSQNKQQKRKIISNNILSQISIKSNYKSIYVVSVQEISNYQVRCFYINDQIIKSMIVQIPLKLYVVTTDPQKLIQLFKEIKEIYVEQLQTTFLSHNNQKLRNVVLLNMNRQYYNEHKRFFQYELSRPYIVEVFGLDHSMTKQFLLDCGAQNQLKSINMMRSNKNIETNEVYENIQIISEEDQFIKRKNIIQLQQYVIYEKIEDQQILIVLTQDKLQIITTMVDVLEEQFQQQHQQYIQYCQSIIDSCQDDQQKKLLRLMIQKYKDVEFELVYETSNKNLLKQFQDNCPKNQIVYLVTLEQNKFQYINNSLYLPIQLDLQELQLYQQIVELIGFVTQLLTYSEIGNIPIEYLLKQNNQTESYKTLETIYSRCFYSNNYLIHYNQNQSKVRLVLDEQIQPTSSNRISVDTKIKYFVAQLIQTSENIIKPVKQLATIVQSNSILLNELTNFLMDSNQQIYLFTVASSIKACYNQFVDQLKSVASTRNIQIIHFSPKKMILLSSKYNLQLALDEIYHIINYMFTETSEVTVQHIYLSLQYKNENEFFGLDYQKRAVSVNSPNFKFADTAMTAISGCLQLIYEKITQQNLLSEQNDKDCKQIEQESFEILKQCIFNTDPQIDASQLCQQSIRSVIPLVKLMQDPAICYQYYDYICSVLQQYENMSLQAQIMRKQIVELIHVNPEKFVQLITNFQFELQCNHCLKSSMHELNWKNSYNKCIFCQKQIQDYQVSQCIIDEIKKKIRYNETIDFKSIKIQCKQLKLDFVVEALNILEQIY